MAKPRASLSVASRTSTATKPTAASAGHRARASTAASTAGSIRASASSTSGSGGALQARIEGLTKKFEEEKAALEAKIAEITEQGAKKLEEEKGQLEASLAEITTQRDELQARCVLVSSHTRHVLTLS